MYYSSEQGQNKVIEQLQLKPEGENYLLAPIL